MAADVQLSEQWQKTTKLVETYGKSFS